MSFLVLFAYQTFFSKPTPVPANVVTPAPAGVVAEPNSPAAGEVGATAAAAPAVAALVGETSERDVTFDMPHVIATFTNRGARLKSWKLKEYRDRNGDPLELIDSTLSATQPLPFSLSVPDAAATAILNTGLYTVTQSNSAGGSEQQVSFEYRTESGLSATKAFSLNPGSYTVTLQTQVSQGGSAITPTILW